MKNACTFESETASIYVSVDTDQRKVKFRFELTKKGVTAGYGTARWLDSILLMIAEGLVEIYSDPRVLGKLFTSAVKRYDGGAQDSIAQNLENDEVGEWALSHVLEDSIGSSENFEVELDLNAWLYHAMHQAAEYDRISNAWAEYYAEQFSNCDEQEEEENDEWEDDEEEEEG